MDIKTLSLIQYLKIDLINQMITWTKVVPKKYLHMRGSVSNEMP